MTLQILLIIAVTVNHNFSLLWKIPLKPQDFLNNPLFDLASAQINATSWLLEMGIDGREGVFGLLKRTAGVRSLSSMQQSVVLSLACKKAWWQSQCVWWQYWGPTCICWFNAWSQHHWPGCEAFVPFLRSFCHGILLGSFWFFFSG